MLTAWCQNLHALGYKSIGYYNAYVSTTNPDAAAILAAGRKGGYFLKLDDGTEFDTFMISGGGQTVATVDFTNPAAIPWYQSLLQVALDIGYDGWMLDFGEYVPPKALFHDGTTGWQTHNAFPVMYEKVVFDYLRQQRGNDFMFFARAGGVGTQAYAPVVWSGDPSASFDPVKGLPANVRAGINAGLSGIAFWGSDISGYTCLNDPPADKEVYLRWAEFGALSSDMHDENACSQAPPSAPPKWTLWSDAETTTVYGQYASLHTRLLPYTYAAAQQAVHTGIPIMRHAILTYPDRAGRHRGAVRVLLRALSVRGAGRGARADVAHVLAAAGAVGRLVDARRPGGRGHGHARGDARRAAALPALGEHRRDARSVDRYARPRDHAWHREPERRAGGPRSADGRGSHRAARAGVAHRRHDADREAGGGGARAAGRRGHGGGDGSADVRALRSHRSAPLRRAPPARDRRARDVAHAEGGRRDALAHRAGAAARALGRGGPIGEVGGNRAVPDHSTGGSPQTPG